MNLMRKKVKRVGRSEDAVVLSPAECHARHLRLQEHADRMNPYEKPRGFVFRAPSRRAYDAWRAGQANPRLW
jgi:hypothetical protein